MWQSVKFICHIDASHWTFFMEKKQDSPGNMSTFELVKSLGLFTYMTELFELQHDTLFPMIILVLDFASFYYLDF